jgi:hypothetical protein
MRRLNQIKQVRNVKHFHRGALDDWAEVCLGCLSVLGCWLFLFMV